MQRVYEYSVVLTGKLKHGIRAAVAISVSQSEYIQNKRSFEFIDLKKIKSGIYHHQGLRVLQNITFFIRKVNVENWKGYRRKAANLI